MKNIVSGSRRLATFVWLAANVAGAFLFLWIASISWIEPELAVIPGASGGAAFVWFLTAVPIFLLSVILNLLTLLWAYVVRRRKGEWPASSLVWLLVLVWGLALYYDGSRHGT